MSRCVGDVERESEEWIEQKDEGVIVVIIIISCYYCTADELTRGSLEVAAAAAALLDPAADVEKWLAAADAHCCSSLISDPENSQHQHLHAFALYASFSSSSSSSTFFSFFANDWKLCAHLFPPPPRRRLLHFHPSLNDH